MVYESLHVKKKVIKFLVIGLSFGKFAHSCNFNYIKDAKVVGKN